jgi:L-alanine-DL-glutamate epimerase-like enolase superfamily enzyme
VEEAHRKQKEGFDFFKLKIGVKPLAKEIAIGLRSARGTAENPALRRRQLRADAGQRAELRREDPESAADVCRAAARL